VSRDAVGKLTLRAQLAGRAGAEDRDRAKLKSAAGAELHFVQLPRTCAPSKNYSMDGDTANLPALLEVAERHRVGMLIDEAHSMLVLGADDRGAVEHFGVEQRVALQYGTFSKVFAAVGGFVSGAADTLDYLRLYANPYGFSCPLPPSVVASVLAGLAVATRDDSLRHKLVDNASFFRAALHGLGVDTGESTTQVVPIIIGPHRRLLYELGHEMLARGLFLAPVDYPSVSEDQVRFRACVTAAHTRADLEEALKIIEHTVVRRLREVARAARRATGAGRARTEASAVGNALHDSRNAAGAYRGRTHAAPSRSVPVRGYHHGGRSGAKRDSPSAIHQSGRPRL
jgi:Aminotransferase class I and II